MLVIYHTKTTALVADESTKSYVYMPIDDARTVAKAMQARVKPRDSLYNAEEFLQRVGYVKKGSVGMENFNLEVVRKDKINVELDPEFFNEKWFEGFREYMYDLYTLEDLADHIAYNVIINNDTFIEGIGIPLRDGKPPYWLKEEDKKDVNEHVNVVYNIYNRDCEIEII